MNNTGHFFLTVIEYFTKIKRFPLFYLMPYTLSSLLFLHYLKIYLLSTIYYKAFETIKMAIFVLLSKGGLIKYFLCFQF